MATAQTEPPAIDNSTHEYTHEQIVKVLVGLMSCMFVTMISSTIVSNALPRIMPDLHGTETSYTWVITCLLLAQTSTTPIWGKLADQFNRKTLLQLAVVVFVVGSVVAGISQSVGMLLAARVVQGIGAGGVQALSQTVMAAIVSPRQRGRYTGYLGATYALATLMGPLVGGPLVSTPIIGWRACFFLGVPVAAVALAIIQRTLHLPTVRRKVQIDYLGSTLLVLGVSTLLAWISLAGAGTFSWTSVQSAILVPVALIALTFAIRVETRAAEPVIPLHLLKHRTILLAAIASSLAGVSLFTSSLFLNQYYQLARGYSPTVSGLLASPLVVGLVVAGIVGGRIVSRTGRWKNVVLASMVLAFAGTALVGTSDSSTSVGLVMLFCLINGLGIGGVTQNLLVAVQNVAPLKELGTTTATVSFFRTLGGAAGVSALGAVLAAHVHTDLTDRLQALGIATDSNTGRDIPDVTTLSAPVLHAVRESYGAGIGLIFALAAPLILISIVLVCLIKETPLRTRAAEQADLATSPQFEDVEFSDEFPAVQPETAPALAPAVHRRAATVISGLARRGSHATVR
jgi:EmrB/QacA subfamily drug resistance transporter